MIRRFTGWHMTAIMLAFFGIVVAVNMLMATLATRTFGGTVVDNSYVASQNFNRWLLEARAQDRLQWRVRIAAGDDGRLAVLATAPAGPIEDATLVAFLTHPLGREPERELDFAALGNGAYRSRQPMPRGRWIVRLSIRRGSEEARFVRDLFS